MDVYVMKSKYHTSMFHGHTWSISAMFIGVFLVLFSFSFLYIMEQNAMLSAKRSVIKQRNIVKNVAKKVSNLEILAIELASHQNLKTVAFSNSMVASRGVKYIRIGDDPVAMK